MAFDINTWRDAMFPVVTKWFDDRYAKRTNVIEQTIGVEDTNRYSFDEYGIGGVGEIPDYNGTSLTELTQKKGFKTTYTTQEKAGVYRVHFKAAKFDMSGEAKKAGKVMADSLAMTIYMAFNRLFSNGWNSSYTGADGYSLFNASHKVNASDADTFSNTGTSAFSIAAITATQAAMRRFVTYDGLPFLCNIDLVGVSPELEPKCREFFGKEARLIPESAENGANPVAGMKYVVIDTLTSKQWFAGDSLLMQDYIKLVYGTRPKVIEQKNPNPLISEYIPYTDYVLGWSDPKCVFGHNPA
jgi:hypothetical protein